MKNTIGFALLLFICLQIQAQNEVVYQWSGAITSSSVKVNAKLTSHTNLVRLVVSRFADLSSPLYGTYVIADASNNKMAALSISGLQSGTAYYYAVEADGIVDNSADDIGRFSTSVTGRFSFRFVTGSCALNSNHPVYTKMQEKNPLLMVVSGDFHYANPNSASDINVHRLPYENNMLSQPASRNFFKNIPLAYMWDDHDYSGDDSDSLEAGRTNARQAYREYVPHYPLAAGAGNEPIYQAFTIGRIRFILTDLRSVRGIGNIASTSSSLSMMGTLQKQWFKDQCRLARDQNLAIAWVSSVSLGGNQADNWGGFRAEREELSNFFKAEGIKNMFIVSGDAHMLAIDNGSNHDYSTGKDNPNHYPVFASAALNHGGSDKGELYSEGKFPNPTITTGQYGVVDVTDNGSDKIAIVFTGYRVTNTGVDSTLATYNFELTTGFVLPVRIEAFTAKQVQRGIQLQWKGTGLQDCGKFEVQHRKDGVQFDDIATITCNSWQNNQLFTFIHTQPGNGLHHYRIRSVETNGNEFYSGVARINIRSITEARILTNPVVHTLKVEFDEPVSENVPFTIINYGGQQVARGWINTGTTGFYYPASSLKKGSYLLLLYTLPKTQRLKFIVK